MVRHLQGHCGERVRPLADRPVRPEPERVSKRKDMTDQRWPVLVTRRLPAPAMERISARCDVTLYDGSGAMPRDELLKEVSGKVGAVTLLTDKVDDEFMDAAGPQLVIVANYAVGFDNIDVPACTRRGVLASNTPEVLTDTTADLAWSLLMAAARRIAEGDRFLRSREPW